MKIIIKASISDGKLLKLFAPFPAFMPSEYVASLRGINSDFEIISDFKSIPPTCIATQFSYFIGLR